MVCCVGDCLPIFCFKELISSCNALEHSTGSKIIMKIPMVHKLCVCVCVGGGGGGGAVGVGKENVDRRQISFGKEAKAVLGRRLRLFWEGG